MESDEDLIEKYGLYGEFPILTPFGCEEAAAILQQLIDEKEQREKEASSRQGEGNSGNSKPEYQSNKLPAALTPTLSQRERESRRPAVAFSNVSPSGRGSG